MVKFLLKLLLKQIFLAVYHDFHWLFFATKLLTANLHSCYAKESESEILERSELESDILPLKCFACPLERNPNGSSQWLSCHRGCYSLRAACCSHRAVTTLTPHPCLSQLYISRFYFSKASPRKGYGYWVTPVCLRMEGVVF